jgi:hypothetical protein
MLLSLVLMTLAAADAGPADAGAADAGPPAGLACLTKWYALEVVQGDGGWSMKLPDGHVYLFDDGKVKSPEEQLEAPDMEDTYNLPYRAGPIVPVTPENDSCGRLRFDPLLRATYGATRNTVGTVRYTFFKQHVMVHRKALEPFKRVTARLEEAVAKDKSLAVYLQKVGGTFNWRKISDTPRQSAHSYGVAIDLNVEHSHYWEWQRPKRPLKWKNRFPQAIVDAFEAEGFIWGGRWDHYDTMHFEYRPELLDPSCRQ